MKAIRFPENPIIRPGMDDRIGENINGPSLIRVPDWVSNALGRYYLYFGHHQGEFIRLAYADDLHGPWRIHRPGTLQVGQTTCIHHIASPDVHVDEKRRQIVMYFHGRVAGKRRDMQGQYSFRAVSADGIDFEASDTVLGPFYFRVFEHQANFYAISKSAVAAGGGVLLRSPDGVAPFEQGPDILPRQRHVAVMKKGATISVFYSRGGDCPERILMSEMDLSGDWRSWTLGEPVDVLTPAETYEGAQLALEPSSFGAIHEPARQLRDPAIFEENAKRYLLYSVAGERGIAIAELR